MYMITPEYKQVAADLKQKIKGEVTFDEVDRERVARDTSIFYVKPELVVYPKHAQDISTLLEYVTVKKLEGFDIAISMRAAGTCMTGGPLSYSIGWRYGRQPRFRRRQFASIEHFWPNLPSVVQNVGRG